MPFFVTILGSSAAIPAFGRKHTAQFLKIKKHNFLIDCGESTQLQLRRYRIKYQRISHIFISHLHGDHFLGLVGLISSMHLQGRTKTLDIYGPPGLDEIITTQLKYSGTVLRYRVNFHLTNPEEQELLFEDELITIKSVPLKHRIHCTGFIFCEKTKPIRINKQLIPEDISKADIAQLKQGNDALNEDGTVRYAAKELTLPPRESRSYAYCSDTIYDPEIIPLIKGVDLLYHEATFLKDRAQWAAETFHSTAEQAAMIAGDAGVSRLLIGHFSARYREISPFLEEARTVFPETFLAREGDKYEIEE